jgi:hypothetical protein
LDVTAEKRAFVPNNVDKSLDILIRLLDKVYPFGSWLFHNAKTWTGQRDCSASFKYWMVERKPKALRSWDNFLDLLPFIVHETVHCMHGNIGKYVPDLLAKEKFALKECSRGSCKIFTDFINGFPKRKDINAGIPAMVKSDGFIYKLYFTGSMGNDGIHQMLTETEAYLHDGASGAWMNDGVGKGNSIVPRPGFNTMMHGRTYALSFWSLASVLYLGRIKSHHKSTWQKMKQKGDSKHAVIGRLFLAHHDRFNFLLELYIDKNGNSNGYRPSLTKLLREKKKKVLAADNFVEELRAALS